MKNIKIGSKLVGEGHPTFIIAEAGINHQGDLDKAKEMVKIAAKAGADAVKFHSYKTERVFTKQAPKAEYMKKDSQKESFFSMAKRYELSFEDYQILMNLTKKKNILFLSTPYDETGVDLLEKLGVLFYKVGSSDTTNLPLLRYIAKRKKPMIVSTGMSDMQEIKEALNVIHSTGNNKIILLQCTSNYPTALENVNLRAIKTLREKFKVPVGFSDHTLGISVDIAAVALGACVTEKHFTLDKNMEGPDHKASLEPHELKEMIRGIRDIEKAFGSPLKKVAKSEIEVKKVARKSIVADKFIPTGVKITRNMLAIKRPGTGLPSRFMKDILGKKAKSDIKKDELIKWGLFKVDKKR